MPGFNKDIINNLESAQAEHLEEHKNNDSNKKIVTSNKAPRRKRQTKAKQQEKKDYFPLGPRGSRTERAYESGLVPAEHQRVLNGFKAALGDATEGEVILQRVLDDIGMLRPSVLRIIKYLVRYGYITYEPRNHHVYVTILK